MYAGIDIGGTKTAVILSDTRGNIIKREQYDTKGGDWRWAVDTAIKILDAMLLSYNINELISIGIVCGSPLDAKKGIILSPPNLPGWDDVIICDIFNKKYNIPCYLENDANACALAEWQYGAGMGCSSMVFLTMGTGMGAGLILDKKLYSGIDGMAGEVGHMRLNTMGPVGYGKSGSFEGFCSGGGIAQLGQMRVREIIQSGRKVTFCNDVTDIPSITAKTIGIAADAGDEFAAAILNEVGYWLGKGLAIITDILNPEIIVIGGIYRRCLDYLKDAAQISLHGEALSINAKRVVIVPADLGEKIGDYSAICIARRIGF